jgi:hypothetical protein
MRCTAASSAVSHRQSVLLVALDQQDDRDGIDNAHRNDFDQTVWDTDAGAEIRGLAWITLCAFCILDIA